MKRDRLIEHFLPRADVRERHETLVHAPAAVVFDVAEHIDLFSIPTVRAIFRLRAWDSWPRRSTWGGACSPIARDASA
jgi:hypothetical protein